MTSFPICVKPSTGKLDAMNETINTLSKMVESLDERTEKKLDLLNKSNAAMSVQIQVLSQRLATLENQGTHTQFNVPVWSISFLWIICAMAHQAQSKLKFLKFKTIKVSVISIPLKQLHCLYKTGFDVKFCIEENQQPRSPGMLNSICCFLLKKQYFSIVLKTVWDCVSFLFHLNSHSWLRSAVPA